MVKQAVTLGCREVADFRLLKHWVLLLAAGQSAFLRYVGEERAYIGGLVTSFHSFLRSA